MEQEKQKRKEGSMVDKGEIEKPESGLEEGLNRQS
jgi:hypothetical protein